MKPERRFSKSKKQLSGEPRGRISRPGESAEELDCTVKLNDKHFKVWMEYSRSLQQHGKAISANYRQRRKKSDDKVNKSVFNKLIEENPPNMWKEMFI